MRKFLPLILMIVLMSFPLLISHSCANTTQAPTGGKKDTIPPYIVDIKPLPGAVGVPLKGASFEFTFNEYVTIKERNNILLSPPQKKRLVTKLKGKKLIVSFEDSLKANTTYTLSFSNAIADANEGNMFAGYTYVFSTGEKIDSMMMTGTVVDCKTLAPVKDVKVLLHKDLADSAIFLHLPDVITKTDDWGFFCLPFLEDTLYRLYAIKDENNNNLLDPDTELVAFIDSLVRPVKITNDSVPEMLRYDMLDTLSCQARESEYELALFKERPLKQFVMNNLRTSERRAHITFNASDAIIDSLSIGDLRQNQIITQFNIERDSLEIWINSRRAAPDTMLLSLVYQKTDSTGKISSSTESFKMTLPRDKRTYSKPRRELKKEDTTCVFSITAKSETVEQNGFVFEFKNPIIYENFDSLKFTYITPRQTVEEARFTVEQDSVNLRKYILRPVESLQAGNTYTLKVPHHAFRDINGFYSDSTEVKVNLPTDDKLSSITTNLTGIDRRIIVDLLNEKKDNVLRSYVVDNDCDLVFPYLKEGKYSLRIAEDRNRNSIIDSGSLLGHRQSEKVIFYRFGKDNFVEIPPSTDLVQDIDISKLFK